MDLREETRELICEILAEYEPWASININGLLEKTAAIIESSCHNANVDKAREKNIPTFWEEETFVEQYSNIVYTVLINIDPKSSVNQDRPPIPPSDTSDVSEGSDVLLIHRILISSVLSCLSLPQSSIDILTKISGIDLSKIGYMSSIEFNPHINQHILDEIETRSAQVVNVKTTEMYLCEKCKQRKTKYWKAQTRSGDEGYTIFIECQVCGHEWRVY